VSCSLHDAISLESAGIPTVAIHTQAFASAARSHASALGRADYVSAFVRHPIAGMSAAEVNARAVEVIEAVHRLLVLHE
jgi:hypothetical protein